MKRIRSSCIVAWAATCGLVGCAQPSTRIADELERYGLDSARSRCVGERLQANLSVDQLRQLAAAARTYKASGRSPEQMTISDLTQVARQVRDPAIPIALFGAAGACGIGISDVLR